MRNHYAQSSILAALAGGAALLVAPHALASNPLEYPDNGSAAFSRGGAWLAVGNEPIATHYNPAALATQGSGFSIEQQLNFNKVCFTREQPGGKPASPDQDQPNFKTPGQPAVVYLPTCEGRGSFPSTIPSISIAWRASARLGFGFAIVPPATYGTPLNGFPPTATGYSNVQGKDVQIAAPYRYMSLNQQSTILFPTWSFGYELFKHFRIGAGLVTGLATINTQVAGVTSVNPKDADGDNSGLDALTTLKTNDLFVPGVVGSIHWSITPNLDVSAWGRWMDSIRTDHGDVTATYQAYNPSGGLNPICNPTQNINTCSNAIVNTFPNNTTTPANVSPVTRFVYPIPPEVRLGVRFHQPRTKAVRMVMGGEARDPLHDDIFDVEVDGSWSLNSAANTVEVRLNPAAVILPIHSALPPNADRYNGYIDSYGVRVGGQWNVLADKFAVRAGGWFESRSVDPAWLNVFPVGATRYGGGGGIVFRQNFIDISFGYQIQGSQGLDNNGNGLLRASTGTSSVNNGGPDPLGTPTSQLRSYRTIHTVNGGMVTQSANAFTLGGTVRF